MRDKGLTVPELRALSSALLEIGEGLHSPLEIHVPQLLNESRQLIKLRFIQQLRTQRRITRSPHLPTAQIIQDTSCMLLSVDMLTSMTLTSVESVECRVKSVECRV
jgi:hypothetical protein